jgi:hypothetical protein
MTPVMYPYITQTDTASQGIQRNNPLSQQVSDSLSRSGHAQWNIYNVIICNNVAVIIIWRYYIITITIMILIIAKTQEATKHSAAPSQCIHSGTRTLHMDLTGTCKQNITSRTSTTHIHANPDPRPTGLCNHSQTCTAHKDKCPCTALHEARVKRLQQGCRLDPVGASSVAA